MSELELHIGKHYSGDDGWEVYVYHPEGGCVTLFGGTEQECEAFVRTRGPELTMPHLFNDAQDEANPPLRKALRCPYCGLAVWTDSDLGMQCVDPDDFGAPGCGATWDGVGNPQSGPTKWTRPT